MPLGLVIGQDGLRGRHGQLRGADGQGSSTTGKQLCCHDFNSCVSWGNYCRVHAYSLSRVIIVSRWNCVGFVRLKIHVSCIYNCVSRLDLVK